MKLVDYLKQVFFIHLNKGIDKNLNPIYILIENLMTNED
jgi:hypothetical protein